MKIWLLFWLMPLTVFAAMENKNGATQFIWVNGGIKNVESTNAVTIALWIKQGAYSLFDGHDIVCKGRSNDVNKILYHLRAKTNHYQFRYCSPDGNFHEWSTTSTYTTNVLRHLAMTYTFGSGSSMKMYLDGESVAGTWITGNGDSNAVVNTSQFMSVAGVGLFDAPYVGIYNEVAIWDVALTAGQVKILATANVKGTPRQFLTENIVIYYPLDDYAPFGGGAGSGQRFVERGLQRWIPVLLSAIPGNTCRPETLLSYLPNE